MPETSIPLGGIHLKLLRLSIEARALEPLEKLECLEKLEYLERLSLKAESLFVKIACSNDIPVVIATGFHLFPFRTEKLSPTAPMVLHTRGRVGRRHFTKETVLKHLF